MEYIHPVQTPQNKYRLQRIKEVHSQPKIGNSGFILQTQKYSPPIVGYALQISAKLRAMNSMNKLHILVV
jgi:hypothetical protein